MDRTVAERCAFCQEINRLRAAEMTPEEREAAIDALWDRNLRSTLIHRRYQGSLRRRRRARR